MARPLRNQGRYSKLEKEKNVSALELDQARKQIVSALWNSEEPMKLAEIVGGLPTKVHLKALDSLIKDDRLTLETDGRVDFL